MPNKHEIASAKTHVKDVFSKMWFRVPEYQRPYVWGNDEIDDLLDDLVFAHFEKPDQDYFLGSFVYQSKKARGQGTHDENNLLDGQQRMTTLFMLFACIRDISDDDDVKDGCQRAIFQRGDRFDDIPELTRITFAIRPEVQNFVDDHIIHKDGTADQSRLEAIVRDTKDPSVRNMAMAILKIRGELTQLLADKDRNFDLPSFYGFIRKNVLLIYVATEDFDDAYRLFTILNNRGVPLRTSDILKSINLGVLKDDREIERYAMLWEKAEGELREDFDRFLNHIRTILLKDKARSNLLDEFEHKIYRAKDKSKGRPKPPLLSKGKDTFMLVEKYLRHYDQLLGGQNYEQTGNSYQFDNLIEVMLVGLPSTDWIPPLMRYFDRFRHERLLDFINCLDNQLSSDWITRYRYSPTKRIERMNDVIRSIETVGSVDELFSCASPFDFGGEELGHALNDTLYGWAYTRYLLLKLDFLYADHGQRMSLETLSVEHVLPQNPKQNSQWRIDFTDDEREEWTNRLGNLVLITTKKNTALSNKDYTDKRSQYFEKRISTCPNSLRVLRNNEQWTPIQLEENHRTVVDRLQEHYRFASKQHV